MRKLLALSLIALLSLITIGCQDAPSAQGESSPGITVTIPPDATNQPQPLSSANTPEGYAAEDLDASWDASTAISIALDGDTIQAGMGVTVSGNQATITKAGTYVLSGESDDAQIIIDAAKNDLVRLVLNGVTLACQSGSPIYAPQANKTILILADGTTNAIQDTESYAFEEGLDEPDATIFCQDDLAITGSGSLTVTGLYRNAIASKDDLIITGGTLNVSAVNDALRGRDAVKILDGDITIQAGNDGIKANNPDDEKGNVQLDGGTYSITSGHDAVQAENTLLLAGGAYTILSGGGSANAPERPAEEFPGGMGGGRGGRFPGMSTDGAAPSITPTPSATPAPSAAASTDDGAADTTEEESESDSYKAFKAGTALTITGGEFTIDARDDAFHSNGDLRVEDGTFAIQTGDDAFHADNETIIQGGSIRVESCYEGIEGATVDITGGDIYINASDDAINAAGGSDESDQAGGPMGFDRFAANDDYWIRIAGGKMELIAQGDGLDSNGNLTIEGGEVYLSGLSMGMEGALDCDGTFTNSGGTLVAAGSVMSPAGQDGQPLLILRFDESKASGSTLRLDDSQGNTLLTYTAQIAHQLAAFSSPDMEIGQTYSVYMDDALALDIELSGAVTSVNQDGSAYTNAHFGPGGGFGGQPPEGSGDWPQGERPNGGKPPEGMELPEGFQLPEGMEPPDGMVPPGGGQATDNPS